MHETRYIIKITPIDRDKRRWPCDCIYMGISGGCGSNLYLCETKEKLFNRAYKSYKDAEFGYKRQLAKNCSMPAIESWTWWNDVKLLPKKERDKLLMEQYEKVKDEYNAEIMTVDKAWDDWTNLFNNKYF